MRSRKEIIYSALILGALLALIQLKPAVKQSETEGTKEAAAAAAAYIRRSQLPDGRFTYAVNFDAAVKLKSRYNILRHSGTIYSLCMYAGFSADRSFDEPLERACEWLQKECLKEAVIGGRQVLAAWSQPRITGYGSADQVKLGGSGLALVALASRRSLTGRGELETLRRLGQCIIAMQKEDGSFYSKFIPSEGGLRDDWVSLYYPGEAALGLVMLAEIDPQGPWLKAASKALLRLADDRRGAAEVPADHWALLATERLLRQDQPAGEAQRLIDHAVQICRSMLDDQLPSGFGVLGGCFSRDGRTTPSSTRLEGLQAARLFLGSEHPLQPRLQRACREGIAFLQRAQITDGAFRGALPRAIGRYPGKTAAGKSFNRRATEIRIDYVQHALSAFVQFLED